MHEGGCLCGAIRYRVDHDPSATGLCHCPTCRRIASAPVLPFSTVRMDDFAITRGRPVAYRSSPHVVRSFCGTCGSPLTYANENEAGCLDVMTCSFDDPDAFTPAYSVWTSTKLAWDEPNPNCPSYPRSRAEGPTVSG